MGSKEHSAHQHLGDFSLELFRFPQLKESLDQLQKTDFLKLSDRKKTEKINALLLSLIQEVPSPCFLLAAVNEFIHAVNQRSWLETYSFSYFELWLNVFSGLTPDENYFVRAKIMGRFVPRETYQILFPIGMGKKHPGSHYVTAHSSPDLDTTVASFWGWIDAFSARVGEGLHIWNVPGGPPESQVEIQSLFYGFLGSKCFDHFAKTRTSLALSAVDLLTQEGVVNKVMAESTQSLEYDKKQKAVILVDEEGNYLADWRHLDVEGVRKVTTLLSGCIRWFSSHFQRQLIAFFSSPVVTKEAALKGVEALFALRFEEMEPVKGYTDKQKKHVEACLIKVLGVSQGWKATAGEFWQAMEKLFLPEFKTFKKVLDALPGSSLFQANGQLIENRPEIFSHLEKIMTSLEEAIQALRIYLDHLGTALMIKKEVFGYPPQTVSSRTEVEEIRSKIGPLSYITVVTTDSQGNQFALGVIPSTEIFKPVLGTVSLRDFCNREETKIPSYFEVISVVDHHKSSLNTLSAATVCIADAQSANVLTAEIAFELNDPYSLSGCSIAGIKEQLVELQGNLSDFSCHRILNRILQKHVIVGRKDRYFVDPSREYLEYIHYLYAILDDTDLLSKLSYRDVVCIASLLNRLKTIQCKKETEVISLEDLPRDEKFVSTAAKRILQNEEMYSLYKKIYSLKELSIEEMLRLCIQDKPSSVFADTKVQNGCCRVGQTKLFVKNVSFYQSKAQEVRSLWYKDAKAFYEERKECDLHMHMISTVPGADDVYQGHEGNYSHQDELWFWIPMEEQAIEHLKTFLNNFRNSPAAIKYPMEVEFLGGNAKELEKIFKESFLPVAKRETEKKDVDKTSLPVAILRYKAGLLNSRKAMISPYLPK
jgi:hypothetical protein